MADSKEIEYFEFDGDEIELELDNSLADFQGDWFVLEIVQSPVTQQVHEKYGKSYSARLDMFIVDNENFEGSRVSTFLPLSDKRPDAARKRKAFCNALNDGEDTGEKVKLTVAKEAEPETGKLIPQVKDIQGKRIGAFVVVNKGYLNVKDDMFAAASEAVGLADHDEDPW